MVRDTRASANAVAAAAEYGEQDQEGGNGRGGRRGSSVSSSANGSINGTSVTNGGRKAPGDINPASENGKKRKRAEPAVSSATFSFPPSRVTRSSPASPSQHPATADAAAAEQNGDNDSEAAPPTAIKRIKLRAGSNAAGDAKKPGLKKIKLKLPGKGPMSAEKEGEDVGGEAEGDSSGLTDFPMGEDAEMESPGTGRDARAERSDGRTEILAARKVFVEPGANIQVGGDSATPDEEGNPDECESAMIGIVGLVSSPKGQPADTNAKKDKSLVGDPSAVKDKEPQQLGTIAKQIALINPPEAGAEAEPEARYSTRRSARHPRAAPPPPPPRAPTRKSRGSIVAASSENGASVDEETKLEGRDEWESMAPATKSDLLLVLTRVNAPSRAKNLLDQVATTGASTSLRARLESSDEISLPWFESLLQRLTSDVYPSCQNPFRSASASTVCKSLSRNRRNKAKVIAEEEYLLSLKRVIDTFSGSNASSSTEPQRTPLPMVRWHLHQRLPASAPNARPPRGIDPTKWAPPPPAMQEWYTSLAVVPDLPAAENDESAEEFARHGRNKQVREDSKEEEQEDEPSGIMEKLYQRSAFGNATPVISAGFALEEETAPRLGDVLLMRASNKVQLWKQKRAIASGEMGFGGHPVEFLHRRDSFTPSFAPTHDSSRTTGGWGYETSAAIARYRTASRKWLQAGWNIRFGENWAPSAPTEMEDSDEETSSALDDGEGSGSLQTTAATTSLSAEKIMKDLLGRTDLDETLLLALRKQGEHSVYVQSLLDQNAKWVQELAYWRDIRTRRAAGPVPGAEEQATADKLMQSLRDLATIASPGQLLETKRSSQSLPSGSSAGLATSWAKLSIPGKTPNYRGTLDPNRRTRALADNITFADKPVPGPDGQRTTSIGRLSRMPALPPAELSGHANPRSEGPGRLDAYASGVRVHPTALEQTITNGSSRPASSHSKPHNNPALPFPSGKVPNPLYGAVPPRPMYPLPNPHADVPYSPFVSVGRTTRDVKGYTHGRGASRPPAGGNGGGMGVGLQSPATPGMMGGRQR